MTDKITYKQIRDRIEASAEEIISCNVEFPKENTIDAWETYIAELKSLRDSDAYGKAYDEVDSWNWCTYTYQGFMVYDALRSDEQDDAESLYWKADGGCDNQPSPYELAAGMAFFWLVEKVHVEINFQIDELIQLAESQLESMES